jgi:hypothetical protein
MAIGRWVRTDQGMTLGHAICVPAHAQLDSVGPAGDKWIRGNAVGTGSTPKAALRDAPQKEPRIDFVSKALQSALFEWPPPSPSPEATKATE